MTGRTDEREKEDALWILMDNDLVCTHEDQGAGNPSCIFPKKSGLESAGSAGSAHAGGKGGSFGRRVNTVKAKESFWQAYLLHMQEALAL